MKQTTKPPDQFELREQWLRENAEALEAEYLRIRTGLVRLYDSGRPSTVYRRSLEEIADAHGEAAKVYRRRMEELR